MITVESLTPDHAVQVAQLHVDLNPTHLLIVYMCEGCGLPIDVMCGTCREPVCAIRQPDCTHAGLP